MKCEAICPVQHIKIQSLWPVRYHSLAFLVSVKSTFELHFFSGSNPQPFEIAYYVCNVLAQSGYIYCVVISQRCARSLQEPAVCYCLPEIRSVLAGQDLIDILKQFAVHFHQQCAMLVRIYMAR